MKVPEGYQSALDVRETEVAIKKVKDFFEKSIGDKFESDTCVSTVIRSTGNGIER